MDNRMGLIAMKGNMAFYLFGQKKLDQCLHDHMIACYNWVGSSWNDKFEEGNIYTSTLNSFKYILSEVEMTKYVPVIIEDKNDVEDNTDGLNHLIANVKSFNNNEIELTEMIDEHIKICATELNDYKTYFKDGWSKDLYLNILKYVVKAVNGDKDAISRLRVDLGIVECNLTIVQVI